MEFRTLDNDLVITNGDLTPITQSTETGQKIKQRLQSYAFEFFLNDEGLPYFEEMVGKGVDANRVEAIIISVINGTYGVRSIESLDIIYDTVTRQTNVNSQVTTVWGDRLTVEAVLPTTGAIAILQDLLGSPLTDLLNDAILDIGA